MSDLSQQILASAQALAAEMAEWRHTLHQHPELGFDLPFTTNFVETKLKEFGYSPEKCGKAGFTVLAGRPSGKVLLLRADMDALPVNEETDVPFKSLTPNQMHACGHDMHTSMLLGAAKILKENENLLEGQVKLMFQPAEEICAGARDMVDAGVLENPHVDAGCMIHVATGMPMPVGTLIVMPGGMGPSASTEFVITVNGKGGHGAMPHSSIDPINALCHIHTAIQEINARENDPFKYLVITVGQIHAGGAPNVIPDTGFMSGTIRSNDNEIQEMARKRITEISEGIAATFRCTASVEFPKSIPAMIADPAISGPVLDYMKELLGPAAMTVPQGLNGGGSEDFAEVGIRIPVSGMFLGAGSSKEGASYPQHHPKAVFSDKVLPEGAAAHVYLAIRWLQDNK